MDSRQRDEWREADRLFQQLVDLNEPARSQALAESGAGSQVRAKLVLMLNASQREHRLLDDPNVQLPWLAVLQDDSASGNDDPLSGHRIGDWKLVELIGRGGMATVYRGELVGHDYAQQAAVKLLGMALRGPVEQARFRREQRILAQLQHPHIASLIDAGVADDGTPFLAMSLVDGERIDSYCVSHDLDISARVKLVLQVCAAVAYAHRQLVIHRDIKPGNILVDANGHATLLDFGIARLLDADSTGEATVTRAFTPDYAAPEQRGGNQALGTACGCVRARCSAASPADRRVAATRYTWGSDTCFDSRPRAWRYKSGRGVARRYGCDPCAFACRRSEPALCQRRRTGRRLECMAGT